jgi:hypothetical protein
VRFIVLLVVLFRAVYRRAQPHAQMSETAGPALPVDQHKKLANWHQSLGRYGSAALAFLTLLVLALQLRTFSTQTKILSRQQSADAVSQKRDDEAAELSELASLLFSTDSTSISISNANNFAIGDPVIWAIGSNSENDFDTIVMRLPILRPCTKYTLTKTDIAVAAVHSQSAQTVQNDTAHSVLPNLQEAHMIVRVPGTGRFWMISDGDAVSALAPGTDTVDAADNLIESYDFADSFDEGADNTRDFAFNASLSATDPDPLTGQLSITAAPIRLHTTTGVITCR